MNYPELKYLITWTEDFSKSVKSFLNLVLKIMFALGSCHKHQSNKLFSSVCLLFHFRPYDVTLKNYSFLTYFHGLVVTYTRQALTVKRQQLSYGH